MIKNDKTLTIKQQQKWREKSHISSNPISWQNIYENNCHASNQTKIRSFQVQLNLRFIVTRVQPHGFEIAEENSCKFCEKKSQKH